MRLISACLTLICFFPVGASAATALTTLRTLLPEHASMVAIMAGRDGAPEPERWHVLMFDSSSETGVREFVIGARGRTANRTLSQFAEKLTMSDIFGLDAIQTDSDRVAQIAMDYGKANNVLIATMHYDLRRGKSGDPSPIWTVTCYDIAGLELGKVIVSAARGTVLQHPGFETGPAAAQPAKVENSGSGSTAATAEPSDGADTTGSGTTTKKATAVRKKTATPAPAAPVPNTPKPNLLRRFFGGGGSR